jgi:hypothetical protein
MTRRLSAMMRSISCGRVMATFILRRSLRKPTPLPLPARTAEKMMISFSLPWKPSTVLTSTSLRSGFFASAPRMTPTCLA